MSERIEMKAACRGCHGGCVHILTVEDGRLVKVRPDPNGPLNQGHACVKGMSIIEQMYHPDRIIYPMKRVGEKLSGKWERITWDEAFEGIAAKIRQLTEESGPECIATVSGTGRHHLGQLGRFASRLQTPNATSSGALICLGPRKNAGMMTCGTFAGVDYYGKTRPGGILVWGANPAISGADGELQWLIQDAVKEGIPLVVVDSQPTELAKAAKVWLRPRPGTDGALALSVIHVLITENLYDHAFVENYTVGFEALKARAAEYPPEKTAEICWVPAEKIYEAARTMASFRPMGLEWGTACEQNPNSFQTCRSIFFIPALLGSWDVPGGFIADKSITMPGDPRYSGLPAEQLAKCMHDNLPLNDGSIMPMVFAHPYLVFEAMRSGKPYPIRALFAHANNTLLSMPEAPHYRDCLEKLEFFVYMDFFMNPTAEYADYFLPAAFWPELDSIVALPEFGEHALLTMRKAVQVGECKSDEEFFMEMSQRLGLDYGADRQEDILNVQLAETGRRYPEYRGIDFEKMKELGYIVPEKKYRAYLEHGFQTPSGKFEFYSETLKNAGIDPLPYWKELPESPYSRPDLAKTYPLVLTTGARIQQFFVSNNRQIRSLRKAYPFPRVSVSPALAAANGIADGDWVWIETPRGRITQKAWIREGMDDRVINCEMGWWYPEAGAPYYGWDESNINMLTVGYSEQDDPALGAYQLRGLLCRIYPNPDCTIEERYRKWMSEQENAKSASEKETAC